MRSVTRFTLHASVALLLAGPAIAGPGLERAARASTVAAPRATPAATLPGEDFETAIVIPSLPFSASGTRCGYVDNGYTGICGNYDAEDVVYVFTPQSDFHVRASLCDEGRIAFLNVFEDDVSTTLACDSEPCSGTSAAFFKVRAGHTYYFVVDGHPWDPCDAYTLTVEPQAEPAAGQTMEDALPITALPIQLSGSTAAYGGDYLLPCTHVGGPDVVYRFVATSSVCVDIRSCSSFLYTALGLFENLNGPLIKCNDNGCDPDGYNPSLLGVSLSPGNTYYLVITGWGGGFGDYVVDISECAPVSTRKATWGQVKAHYR